MGLLPSPVSRNKTLTLNTEISSLKHTVTVWHSCSTWIKIHSLIKSTKSDLIHQSKQLLLLSELTNCFRSYDNKYFPVLTVVICAD